MSSTTSPSTTKAMLPSVTDILEMTSFRASECCSKLCLPNTGSKKQKQTALIEYVVANRNEGDSTKAMLGFNKETTTFEWSFSRAELRKCDVLPKGKSLESSPFVDKNGFKWRIDFNPKGNTSSSPKKAAVFLHSMNFDTDNTVLSARVAFALCHTESGETRSGEYECGVETSAHGRGWKDFMAMASRMPTECPICLQQKVHKMTTLCGHTFCHTCTFKLFGASRLCDCPICRGIIARDDLVVARYSALDSFTLKATVRTLLLERNTAASATLGDVLHMSKSLENKLSQHISALEQRLVSSFASVSGFKRNFSEMNATEDTPVSLLES